MKSLYFIFLALVGFACKKIQLDVSEIQDGFGGKNPVVLLKVVKDRDFRIIPDEVFYCSGFLTDEGIFTDSNCLDSGGSQVQPKDLKIYTKLPNEPNTHEFKILQVLPNHVNGEAWTILLPEKMDYLKQTFGTFSINNHHPNLACMENREPSVQMIAYDPPQSNLISSIRLRKAHLVMKDIVTNLKSIITSKNAISPLFFPSPEDQESFLLPPQSFDINSDDNKIKILEELNHYPFLDSQASTFRKSFAGAPLLYNGSSIAMILDPHDWDNLTKVQYFPATDNFKTSPQLSGSKTCSDTLNVLDK